VKPDKRRLEAILEPVCASALPLARGEILRITQIEGGQGVDFNCFSLDDHKEYMSVGHMRREDFRVGPGRFLWSNPPRFRPMMQVLSMPPGCAVDTLAPRCSAAVVESQFGIDDHPNCQDTLAEAIGEYGLTPDDVHDSLNLWRDTGVDHIGFYEGWNGARAGDAIELLAVMDVLAVPAICGVGNLSVSGNFSYKPVRLEVFAPSAQSKAAAAQAWKTHASLKSQKLTDRFLNAAIRTQLSLEPAAGYEPQFVNFPIEWREIEVLFSDEEYRSLWKHRGTLGDTDEEVVRTLFLHWYLDNRKKQGLRWYLPKNAHS
jgi:uncharacterized protein YcgI (DUF1989 family)